MEAIKRIAPTAARLVLGLIFFVFGLNGFLQFMPMPPMPDAAGAFVGALAATGYLFPVLKAVEVVAGLLLLAGRAVPLALVILAPIIVNIALFHWLLAPSLGMVAVLVALETYLCVAHRAQLLPLLASGRVPAAD